jgi:rare lipoprotein A
MILAEVPSIRLRRRALWCGMCLVLAGCATAVRNPLLDSKEAINMRRSTAHHRWIKRDTGARARPGRSRLAPAGSGIFRTLFARSNLLVIVVLQVALLQPANAANSKPDECGLASVYSSASEETASDEDTLPDNFTAAHRTLPFGTLVRVENKKNGRSAVVRITDRGPAIAGRIIDISQVAARALDISGLAQVCLKIISVSERRAAEDH